MYFMSKTGHELHGSATCCLLLLISLCIYFSVTDADGEMKVTEVASRPLVQDLLNHEVSWCNIDQIKNVYTLFNGHTNMGANTTMKDGMVVRLV